MSRAGRMTTGAAAVTALTAVVAVAMAASFAAPGCGGKQETGIEVQVQLVPGVMDQLQIVEVVASSQNGFDQMATTSVADGVTAGTNPANELVVTFRRSDGYPFRDTTLVFQLVLPTSANVAVKLVAYGRNGSNSLLTNSDAVSRTVIADRMQVAALAMACSSAAGDCAPQDGGIGTVQSVDQVAAFEIHTGRPPAAVAVCHLTDATTADLVIGVPTGQGDIASTAGGRVLVYRGKGRSWTGSLSVTPGATGGPDLVIVGTQDAEQIGAAVACGPLTGGAFDDLIIGAPQADGQAGRVYVFTGASLAGPQATVGVPVPPNDGGPAADGGLPDGGVVEGMYALYGPAAGARAGSALAVARLGGSRPTLVIGAPGAAGGDGAVYLVPGAALTQVPGPPLGDGTGFVLPGATGEALGTAVAAGTLTAASPGTLDDVAIGAPGGSGADGGVVVVLPAGQAGSVSDAGVVEPSSLLRIAGPGRVGFGQAIAIGDFNHDGTFDLAMGAPSHLFNGDTERGSVWVLKGESSFFTPPDIDLNAAGNPPHFLVLVGGQFNSARFGSSVAFAVPGDATQAARRQGDLWVGAPSMENNRGLVVLVAGGAAVSGTIDTAQEGATKLKLAGVTEGDRLGAAVAAGPLGDGDTIADLVVTAPGVQENGAAAGVVYGIMNP